MEISIILAPTVFWYVQIHLQALPILVNSDPSLGYILVCSDLSVGCILVSSDAYLGYILVCSDPSVFVPILVNSDPSLDCNVVSSDISLARSLVSSDPFIGCILVSSDPFVLWYWYTQIYSISRLHCGKLRSVSGLHSGKVISVSSCILVRSISEVALSSDPALVCTDKFRSVSRLSACLAVLWTQIRSNPVVYLFRCGSVVYPRIRIQTKCSVLSIYR